MKTYIPLFLLALSALTVSMAQQADSTMVGRGAGVPNKTQKVSIKPYGFVRNYLVFDSRRAVTVCGGDYIMIPYDEDWNIPEDAVTGAVLPDGSEERFDRNATPQSHFQALSSRIGVELHGPQLLGANSSGKFEGDFAGFGTNNTVLRLRLAYVRLEWECGRGDACGEANSPAGSSSNREATTCSVRHSLLIGQDWHPLSGNIMPEVLGMAAGAPFRPHSRTPQVRYELEHGMLRLMAAAMYQYQFTTPGPAGESTQYANESLVPELFLGVGLRNDKLYAQLGADFSSFYVRETMNALPDGTPTAAPYQFHGRVNSLSPTLYFQYAPGLFSLKMRSTLGQNLGHLTMLSGYARVLADGDLSTWHYKPLTNFSTYVDLAYGKRWRTNLLLGYMKNLGLADGYSIDAGAIFMKKGIKNLNSIYRIAPSISFNTKAFNIGMEYEWTAATYGDLQPDGTVASDDNLRQVSNHRICLLVKYNF